MEICWSKIVGMKDSILIANGMKFITNVPCFLCRTITKSRLYLLRWTNTGTIGSADFTNFYRGRIYDKHIGKSLKFTTQVFPNFFNIWKHASSSFIGQQWFILKLIHNDKYFHIKYTTIFLVKCPILRFYDWIHLHIKRRIIMRLI